jgi:hypothetical protein
MSTIGDLVSIQPFFIQYIPQPMTTGKTPKTKKMGKDSRALTTNAEPQIIQSNEATTPIRSFRVSRDKSI